MQPLSIIEYLNVVEQGGFRLFPGFKVAAMDAFCLERVEKALHGGVVQAVSLAAHGGFHAVAFMPPTPQLPAY